MEQQHLHFRQSRNLNRDGNLRRLLGYRVTNSDALHAPFSISISPSNPTFPAGSSVTFTAPPTTITAIAGPSLTRRLWSITIGAGGSWNGNIYTSAKTGIWTVTANYDGLPGTATLTVSFANVYSVSISPRTTSIQAGTTQAFTATASDIYGNTWDVTSSTA